MQQIYSNVTKVLVESRQGSNLLYLPLDKIMQMTAASGAAATPNDAAPNTLPGLSNTTPNPALPDSRARDGRQRERDVR
jgi:membrane protease subunit HflK